MELAPVHTLDITGVLSESKRINKANPYFAALFLPLFFSLSITPTLDHLHKFPSNRQTLIIFSLLYVLTVYTLALCAIATITYSTYHAFFGEPVNFLSSLRSLTYSFFPVVSTAVVANVLLLVISICFLMFVGGILMFIQNLGFVIDYNSVYFMWFSTVVGVTLMIIIMYFYVEWSLAFVVVVVESKWGLAPLMRSSYLVKGMRSVSLKVMLLFGISGAFMAYIMFYPSYDYLSNWNLVLLMVIDTYFLIQSLLCIIIANTVLYVHCKAIHGELAIDTVEGFIPEYINLPSNDENVVIA